MTLFVASKTESLGGRVVKLHCSSTEDIGKEMLVRSLKVTLFVYHVQSFNAMGRLCVVKNCSLLEQ